MAKILPNTSSSFSIDQPAEEPECAELEREFEKVIRCLRQEAPEPRSPALRTILAALKSKSSLAMEED